MSCLVNLYEFGPGPKEGHAEASLTSYFSFTPHILLQGFICCILLQGFIC